MDIQLVIFVMMALTSPSPQSSTAAIPPASSNSSVPPSLSETPAPSNTSTPSNSSVAPQSPPFAIPDAPPPSTLKAIPTHALSPPLPQISPPPSPPLSPPPPSPVTLPRPPLPVAQTPAKTSPYPPDFAPPPPLRGSPPKESPVPQVTTPPPPLAVNPTPPSPVVHSSPPSSVTPPAPVAKSPANAHPLPIPSPSVHSAPSVLSPPISTQAPPNESSSNESSPPYPLPIVPKEKPTARSTAHDPTTTNNVSPRNAGGLGIRGGVAIGIAIGFVALSLALLAVWSRQRRKREGSDLSGSCNPPSPSATSQNSGSSFMRPEQPFHQTESTSGTKITYPEPGGVGYSKSRFTYEELAEATCGFSARNLLGEGGFGCVYKGILPDGREVAVKQLKIGGAQGEREFKTEVEIISRVHHRHLVSLVGYCIAEHERLLVYDYVPNNTLHYHLHGEGRPIMDWVTRVKVAAGAARGLAYLHEDCHPRIIHRDIKSSNILLDYNFDAQVGDFGLAKLALDAYTHVTTRVMGTFGYMAPEYASSGKLSEKSDVFSFGVVLLEVITGRKPVISSQPLGAVSLVAWARPLLTQALDKQDFEELVDQKLGNNFSEREMFRMIEAAAACVRHLPAKRPRMSQVVRAIDSMFEFSDLTNGMKPGQSEIFNSREQSAQIRIFQRMAFGNQDYSSDFFNHSKSC